jgi:hypothetical protein
MLLYRSNRYALIWYLVMFAPAGQMSKKSAVFMGGIYSFMGSYLFKVNRINSSQIRF